MFLFDHNSLQGITLVFNKYSIGKQREFISDENEGLQELDIEPVFKSHSVFRQSSPNRYRIILTKDLSALVSSTSRLNG